MVGDIALEQEYMLHQVRWVAEPSRGLCFLFYSCLNFMFLMSVYGIIIMCKDDFLVSEIADKSDLLHQKR